MLQIQCFHFNHADYHRENDYDHDNYDDDEVSDHAITMAIMIDDADYYDEVDYGNGGNNYDNGGHDD